MVFPAFELGTPFFDQVHLQVNQYNDIADRLV